MIELLANATHKMWSHWMEYMLGQCTETEEGDLVIPAKSAKRWRRQMAMEYEQLTEKEKQSDRDVAEKFLWSLFLSA